MIDQCQVTQPAGARTRDEDLVLLVLLASLAIGSSLGLMMTFATGRSDSSSARHGPRPAIAAPGSHAREQGMTSASDRAISE